MDQELHNALEENFYILTIHDEVSSIYSCRLFAKISSFERKLKELIILVYISEYGTSFYHTAIEKTNLGEKVYRELKKEIEEVTKVDFIQESIWKMELGALYKFLFEDDIQERYKKRLETCDDIERPFMEHIYEYLIENHIEYEWEYLFEQHTLGWNAKEDVTIIKKCRNHISHANIIRHAEYVECIDTLKRADGALSDAITAINPGEGYKTVSYISQNTEMTPHGEGVAGQISSRNIALDYKVILEAN